MWGLFAAGCQVKVLFVIERRGAELFLVGNRGEEFVRIRMTGLADGVLAAVGVRLEGKVCFW
jgi:hypothetical protein